MRSDEIKRERSMSDVAAMYGLKPNRSGFVSCPFHREKTASMKIYKDSYYCFGCGANGDVFSFVMEMEHCDFKTAYYTLGGTYEKPTFESKLAVCRAQKNKEMKEKQRRKLREKKKLNNDLIDIYRDWMNRSEPLSDRWCECYNALQYQLYLHEELNGEEVKE